MRFRDSIDPAQLVRLRVLDRLSRTPFTAGCSVELLVDGASTYRRMRQEIDKARSDLLVLFYKVADDRCGRALKDLLIKKVAQGLRVHFVYDPVSGLQPRVEQMLIQDFARAQRLDLEELGRIGILTRLGTKVARLFLPIL